MQVTEFHVTRRMKNHEIRTDYHTHKSGHKFTLALRRVTSAGTITMSEDLSSYSDRRRFSWVIWEMEESTSLARAEHFSSNVLHLLSNCSTWWSRNWNHSSRLTTWLDKLNHCSKEWLQDCLSHHLHSDLCFAWIFNSSTIHTTWWWLLPRYMARREGGRGQFNPTSSQSS